MQKRTFNLRNVVKMTVACLAATTFLLGCNPINTGTEQDSDIVTFTFTGIDGSASINKSARTVTAKAKETVDLTAIKAEFKLSLNATATVNGVTQASKQTANNFTTPVTYSVTSGDGKTTNEWTVTVTKTGGDDNHGFYYTVPENVRFVKHIINDGSTKGFITIIKVGEEFYGSQFTPSSEMTVKFYIKQNTPTAGRWTRYERIISGGVDTGWEAGANRDNWWIWFNDEGLGNWMVNSGDYAYCKNGDATLVGTEVIAGVLTNKYVYKPTESTYTYWMDPITKIFLKNEVSNTVAPPYSVILEVKEWSTNADFSGLDLP